ncbi:MAG: hypothetical protein WD025_03635 [Bacteriovoracaceae bacterium]
MDKISRKIWIAIIAVATVILIALQYLALNEDHDHWYDKIPGFWSLFGFIGCWLIVVASKKLGKLFIQTEEKEDKYVD